MASPILMYGPVLGGVPGGVADAHVCGVLVVSLELRCTAAVRCMVHLVVSLKLVYGSI